MSCSSFAMANPLVGLGVSEKLTRSNFVLWKAQILAVVKGARLEGFLTGTARAPATKIKKKDGGNEVDVINPEYETWAAIDQQVLGYLLSSMGKDALTQVASCKTATEAWTVTQAMFASMTRARVVNTRIALATMKKGNLSIAEYVGKMRALGDEMAPSGKSIDDDELVSYILVGLDYEYDSVVTTLTALTRTESLSVADVYAQLLSYEQRQHLQQQGNSSVNMARRGRGVGQRGRGDGRGGGRSTRGRGRSNGASSSQYSNDNNRSKSSADTRPKCQLCYKRGHTVIECWHRFDENFVPDERFAGTATTNYGADSNWYNDTGATDHVIGDLDKLTVRDKYQGNDQIHAANGSGPSHEENSS